jgi:O-antigen/teichoic acid export membrane protein
MRSAGQSTVMAATPLSGVLRHMRAFLGDALYRGSLYLLANTLITSVIGFVFWTLAAHKYSAPEVGTFSGISSGAILLATIAAFGLPIIMTRHIATAENARGLVLMAIMVIATVGTMLCLVTILFLGPHLPSSLHIQQRGSMALLVTVIVVFTAVGSALDAGLVATRQTRFLLIKNLSGSTIKLAAMPLLTAFGSAGLLMAFGLGLVICTLLSGVALARQIKSMIKRRELNPFSMPWHYLSNIPTNYLATIIGILPLSVVPIEVLAVRGAAQTASFSAAFLIAGFLNFIPSTTAQVLFAEIARGGTPLGRQFRKALRAVYGLLLPSLVLVLALAPAILRLFGRAYEADATGCLRVLSLSALAAGGTYLVDSLLIARDRRLAYAFMQIANAILVLGSVGILLPRGLTVAAVGWDFAQCLTLALGLCILAAGRSGRHHPKAADQIIAQAEANIQPDVPPWPDPRLLESQIRGLLATWPAMPTAVIADQIGWKGSFQSLLDYVIGLRSAHPHADRRIYVAGEAAVCGLLSPQTDIPVGFGQRRSAKDLTVLTLITGYSHWLSAILLPSERAEDISAGLWQLLVALRAIPRTLAWPTGPIIGEHHNRQVPIIVELTKLCQSLGAAAVVRQQTDTASTDLIEEARSSLVNSFLLDRTFNSPDDFNLQLRDWLAIHNRRCHPRLSYAPAELIVTDRKAMWPLPPVPPATGWRLQTRITDRPFVSFDANEYSVPPALMGRAVELIADLDRIRVLCDGRLTIEHNRAWAHRQTIRKDAYGAAAHQLDHR